MRVGGFGRVVVALAAIVVLGGCGSGEDDEPAIKIQTIIDGDEFTAALVDGGPLLHVRVLGIEAPELTECHGPESKAYAEEILRAWDRDLRLRFDVSQPRTDPQGHTLAYPVNDIDVVFSDTSVFGGHARAYSPTGPVQRQQAIERSQAQAQSLSSGLWGPPCLGAAAPPAVLAPPVTATTPTTTTTAAPPTTDVDTDVDRPYVPAPPRTTARTPDLSESDSSGAYYKNCREARAAGAAPIYAGEPGYSSDLDANSDGVACER